MSDIPEGTNFQLQLGSMIEGALPVTITDEEFTNEYTIIKHYLLLRCLTPAINSQEIIDKLDAVIIPGYFEVSELMYKIRDSFFRDPFEKIFIVYGELPDVSDIECAEFLLSRCQIMCDKPTLFSFVLVGSFLIHFAVRYYNEMECYRILYIAEFCFDVLFGRVFSKVFQSKEDYRKLQLLGVELSDDDTLDLILNKWMETPFAVDWVGVVQKCVDITDDTFPLSESEVELYKKIYSFESNMEDNNKETTRSPEKKTINDYFQASKYYQSDCSTCGSKCYNYLNNLNFIKAIADKYFN